MSDRLVELKTLAHWVKSTGPAPTLRWAVLEIERLRRASRTRPDYDLRCQQCGAPHWLDTSLPSEIWNQIAEPGDLLCLLCIEERLQNAGFTAEAEFYYCGQALTSKSYQASGASEREGRA